MDVTIVKKNSQESPLRKRVRIDHSNWDLQDWEVLKWKAKKYKKSLREELMKIAEQE